jgi:thiol:disulfide interchange protein
MTQKQLAGNGRSEKFAIGMWLAAACLLTAAAIGCDGQGTMMQPWQPWSASAGPKAEPVALAPVEEVAELKQILATGQPVLVDYYKESCPTCVLQDGVLEGLNGEYGSKVHFVKFKIREATMISSTPEFMEEQRLFWVPTTILYVGGVERNRWTLNHMASEFRPALAAASQGGAIPVGSYNRVPARPADANQCTGEGCPIIIPTKKVVDRTPRGTDAMRLVP